MGDSELGPVVQLEGPVIFNPSVFQKKKKSHATTTMLFLICLTVYITFICVYIIQLQQHTGIHRLVFRHFVHPVIVVVIVFY